MSRTMRNKIEGYEPEYLLVGQRDKKRVTSGTIGGKKLTPYSTIRGKFGVDKVSGNHGTSGYGNKVTQTSKTVTANANRSLKKGVRQKAKIEIKKELEAFP